MNYLQRTIVKAMGLVGFILPQVALAVEGEAEHAVAAGATPGNVQIFLAIASGLCIALSVMAGATAQGRAASTALSGIARNPGASGKIFVPMIIGLALIESLVIYALIISFLLLGKI